MKKQLVVAGTSFIAVIIAVGLLIAGQHSRADRMRKLAANWATACLAPTASVDIKAAVSRAQAHEAVAYLARSGPEPQLSCKQKARVWFALDFEAKRVLPLIDFLPELSMMTLADAKAGRSH